MSKYRVKSGLHIVNNQLLRVGECVTVKGDGFLTPERAPFFEKIEEPKKAKEPEKAKEPDQSLGGVGNVGESGELGPVGIPAEEPKKRGPKPKTAE